MRILLCVLVMTSVAFAETYVEKKDSDAIAAIERSLGKVGKAPALFDGTAIPPGAKLTEVKKLRDDLARNLDAARRSYASLSPAGAGRPAATQAKARLDDLERYFAALGPAYDKASREDAAAANRKHAADKAAITAAGNTCSAFLAEIQKANDSTAIGAMVNLLEGRAWFWQTVEAIRASKATLARVGALCKRPEFTGVGEACRAVGGRLEVRYCEAAQRADEILKKGVANLMQHHMKNTGPAQTTKELRSRLGWISVDTVVTWQDYFSGAALREQLRKQVAPLTAEAGMSQDDAKPLFDQLGAEFAALEKLARELAPTWDLPGAPCAGEGCAAAQGFMTAWYRGSSLRRFHHTEPGWKIVTEGGLPVARERGGYAMFQVPGDPMCQLREWNLREQHAGGGRYTPARDVILGPVRWQPCK